MMVVQDYSTILAATNSNNNNLDNLFFYIWFEYYMNFDKDMIKNAYIKAKEKNESKVDADTLRELGYSEEEIAKATFE